MDKHEVVRRAILELGYRERERIAGASMFAGKDWKPALAIDSTMFIHGRKPVRVMAKDCAFGESERIKFSQSIGVMGLALKFDEHKDGVSFYEVI